MATKKTSKKARQETITVPPLDVTPVGGLFAATREGGRDIDVAPGSPSHFDDRLNLLINPEVVEEATTRSPLGLPIPILKAVVSLQRFGLIELRPIVKTGRRYWASFRPTSKIEGLSAEEKQILFDLTRRALAPESPFGAEVLPESQGREIRSRLLLIFGEDRDLSEAQTALRNVPNVRAAEPPVRLYPVTAVSMPLPEPDPRTRQVSTTWTGWGRDMVQIPSDFDSAPVDNIAVLDSGVDRNHPVFHGNPAAIEIPSWIDHPFDWPDEYGHGTHVCSVIAARPVDFKSIAAGVLPKSTVLSFNIFRKRTDGEFEVDMDAFKSALFAIRSAYPNIKVINLSIWMKNRPDTDILDEFARLDAKGIVVVACATNQSDDTDLKMDPWKDSRFRVQFPARLKGILSVGAVDNSSSRAPFSCYSTWGTNGANGNDSEAYLEGKWPFVDIMAPGVAIWGAVPNIQRRTFFKSSVEGAALMKGTSMAAPYVTAAVGFLCSHAPWKSAPAIDVRRAIRKCVDTDHIQKIVGAPANSWSTTDLYGYGLLSCQSVLDKVRSGK